MYLEGNIEFISLATISRILKTRLASINGGILWIYVLSRTTGYIISLTNLVSCERTIQEHEWVRLNNFRVGWMGEQQEKKLNLDFTMGINNHEFSIHI